MAKGGRYLNNNKTSGTEKKKGRGWKVALIIIAILALMIGGVAIAGMTALDAILDKLTPAPFVEQTIEASELEDLSTMDFNALINGSNSDEE